MNTQMIHDNLVNVVKGQRKVENDLEHQLAIIQSAWDDRERDRRESLANIRREALLRMIGSASNGSLAS